MPRTHRRRATFGLAFAALAAVVGTSLAATPAVAMDVSRIAGNDRFETAAAISRSTPTAGATVFLASGAKFPDALAAGPVAAAEDAHLLLTGRDGVPDAVMAELRRLRPTEVVLVGDRNSIADTVGTTLRDELGTEVVRIAGADRLQTSLRLLDRLRERSTAPMTHIWVVAGGNFPDALVAGSIAGRSGGGVLLDWHGSSTAEVDGWRDQIRSYVEGVEVRIAGSSASVSDSSARALEGAGAMSVSRFAGSDRYRTAAVINDAFAPSAPTGRMLLATGQNFPDALAGSLLAAERAEPLYLAPTACSDGIAALLRSERDQRSVSTVVGLGGRPSLSDAALRLEDCPPPPPPPAQPQPAPPAGPPPSASVNCSDFSTQARAQAWFDYWFPTLGDVAGLDRDRDGRACETLP